jgi:carbon monoxide dehydrogenase subunit G
MRIEDQFAVSLPLEEAWRLLLDVERIAPCMPGAQLQEVEGDEYRGVVKVKVGPITAQYKGTARLESTDEDAHTAVIVASGRDTRGQGNASATVQLALAPEGDGTRVTVDTDLSITGKVAQFGRGVLVDVSGKLLAQFVENLERDVLAAPPTEPVPAEPGRPPPEAGPTVVAHGNGAGPATPPGTPGVRRIEGGDAEAVDLLAVGGGSVGKRLLPVALVVALLVVLVGIRRRRRRAP